MLGLMRGDGETGWYNAAYRLYEGFSHIPSVISFALTPRLARYFVTDRHLHRRLAWGGLAGAAAAAAATSAAAVTLAPQLVTVCFGSSYLPSAPALRILAVGFVVAFPLAVLHAVAMSVNAERSLLVTASVGCAANVLLNLVLIPRFGMHGAAAATVAGELISLGVLAALLVRRKAATADAMGLPAGREN